METLNLHDRTRSLPDERVVLNAGATQAALEALEAEAGPIPDQVRVLLTEANGGRIGDLELLGTEETASRCPAEGLFLFARTRNVRLAVEVESGEVIGLPESGAHDRAVLGRNLDRFLDLWVRYTRNEEEIAAEYGGEGLWATWRHDGSPSRSWPIPQAWAYDEDPAVADRNAELQRTRRVEEARERAVDPDGRMTWEHLEDAVRTSLPDIDRRTLFVATERPSFGPHTRTGCALVFGLAIVAILVVLADDTYAIPATLATLAAGFLMAFVSAWAWQQRYVLLSGDRIVIGNRSECIVAGSDEIEDCLDGPYGLIVRFHDRPAVEIPDCFTLPLDDLRRQILRLRRA